MRFDPVTDVDGNEYWPDEIVLVCAVYTGVSLYVCLYMNPYTGSLIVTVENFDAGLDCYDIITFSDLQRAILLYNKNVRGSVVTGE